MPPSKLAKKAACNKIRINAGVWRSRMLKFPDVEGLRPTPERVRITVFNWLGQDLTGKTCLDLFAGTGAFGLEALSRNAKHVTMVENSRLAYQSLLQNQIALKADSCVVLNQDALLFLKNSAQKFDIIFCDPPFNKGWFGTYSPSPQPSPIKGKGILFTLQAHLAVDGVVYVEAEFKIKSDATWQVLKQNKAGNVYYHLLSSFT